MDPRGTWKFRIPVTNRDAIAARFIEITTTRKHKEQEPELNQPYTPK